MQPKFLEDYCQILQTFYRAFVPDNTSFSHMSTYSKSILTGLSVNSTLEPVFNFKKLKIIYY